MSLKQYNSLISGMLKQWHALTKLRAEIERREERVYWECKRFGHLTCNCRNRKEEILEYHSIVISQLQKRKIFPIHSST